MGSVPVLAVAVAVAAAVVVLAVLLVGLRAFLLRHPPAVARRQSMSAIGMDEIWDTWRQGALAPLAVFAGERPTGTLDPAALDLLRRDLLDTEMRVLADPQPLQALRREIMAGVDRCMLTEEILALPETERSRLRSQFAEVIQSDADARRFIAANTLRTRLLRYYGAAKFADRAANDWFDVYEQAARKKRRSINSFITRQPAGGEARYRAAAAVGEQLRTRLLSVPPGTSFPAQAHDVPPQTIASTDGE